MHVKKKMTKNLGLRLEPAEHAALVERAKEVGLSLQAAGRAAVLEWTGNRPAERLTKQERAVLDAVLAYLRDKPEPWGLHALDELVKRYVR